MKVEMLMDATGSPDGIRIIKYLKEHQYEIGKEISINLVNGWTKQGKCKKVIENNIELKPIRPEETRIIGPQEIKDYSKMSYKELQKEAKIRGIKHFGVKKKELIKQLSK